MSRKTTPLSSSEIELILESARQHNEKNEISGLLCFSGDYFLQCLEGERSRINQTYSRIISDDRHTDIQILSYDEVDIREFSHWSMHFVPATILTREILLEHSASATFNPYQLSAKGSLQLMKALSVRLVD